MDGVITRQSEEYIMMMRMLKKCSKEILEFQDLPVPIAGEVYMTGEQICGMLHISNRTLQKLRDERGIAYTVIGGKFLYPLSKLQLLLEENYRNYQVDNLYLCYFFATFVKVSKSVTGRKLQHIRGELFGVIGAEAFGKILIMNREIKS